MQSNGAIGWPLAMALPQMLWVLARYGAAWIQVAVGQGTYGAAELGLPHPSRSWKILLS
jgi:hypothetical protein